MARVILPRNEEDPTGQNSREVRAMRAFAVKMNQVGRLYQDALKATPVQAVTVNQKVYQFDLNPDILANLLAEIEQTVDRILLEGGEDRLWFSVDYVIPAYQQGTATNWANLGAQSTEYAASRATLETLLMSPPYQRRIGFLRARQFENMVGFSNTAKTQMSRILSDGMVNGLNPLDISRQLTQQLGVEKRRADRIARTEVPNAFRQARLDEAQAAAVDLGIRSVEMHLSALSPTTRPSHRARHATLHTAQEQRLWWAQDGNSVNCKCSTVSVLVDAKGVPLDPTAVKRAEAMKG